jgi:putative transposase
VHKVANVLDALPKSAQPTARKMLTEIRDAEDRDHALAAAQRFDAEFRARWPKAADKIREDLDRLVTFYDFPAEHWLHLKTSNPIESTFSTVRLRTNVTKGPGPERRAWRWRSSSSRPPKADGERSTGHTSSRSCAPVPRSEKGC